MLGSALGYTNKELNLRGKSGIVNLGFIWIYKWVHQRWWKTSPAKYLWDYVWVEFARGPSLFHLFIRSCLLLTNSLTFPPLCSRRDSVWRPSSVSVLSTQSLTVTCPLAPLWQMYRKSIRNWRSCSSLTRSPCLKMPWWALTPDTGATRKALSTMQTWQASGASVRVAPASFPSGAPGMMNWSGTSPGLPHRPPLPFWKLPASPLI